LNRLGQTYRTGLALLTDLYQITMAYGYWKLGLESRQSVFHLYFRKSPFGGGYAIAAGLADVAEFVRTLHFEDEDLDFLNSLTGNDGKPLFDPGFTEYLRKLEWNLDIDAIPEGTVVFPNEPLVRVTGSILQAQLLETTLLALVNFPTLVATKAARVCHAAAGQPVLEFGLRRAQGIDGALTASRAAYLGGCAATSNVLAGRMFKIPVKGTHAHSWVISFDSEQAAFDAYAQVQPNNCTLLVDTFDTLSGVRHAAETGLAMRERGGHLAAIRLDSGDLAYLSAEARRILDEAGLHDTKVLVSNDLNETIIESIRQQGGMIDMWGVGTQLVTSYDQPSLGGVYKLSAVRERISDPWEYKLKLSEQVAKISIPGVLQVRRYRNGERFVADAVWSEPDGLGDPARIVDPTDATRTRRVDDARFQYEDLLIPVFRGGRQVHEPAPLEEARARVQKQLGGLHSAIKRHLNPHEYPVGLAGNLHELRVRLIEEAREEKAVLKGVAR
jgi:nicotinate phosphoribosyltransferase